MSEPLTTLQRAYMRGYADGGPGPGGGIKLPGAVADLVDDLAEPTVDEAINVLRRAGYIVHTNEGECYAVIAKRPDQGDPYPELRREVEAERAQQQAERAERA